LAAIRKLKERIVLHQEFLKRKSEEELMSRLDESVVTTEKDLKLQREILDRI
jgi:hypothetical protein